MEKFKRKAYNFLYKNFLLFFSSGIIKIVFKKHDLISQPLNGVLIDHILKDQNDLLTIKVALQGAESHLLGFIDHNGNIVTPYKLNLNQPVKSNAKKKREKFVIELLVLSNNIVVLRKIHKKRIIFFREVYAMYLLRKKGLFIPKIYDYKINSMEIIMEYIDGINLKNLLYNNGAGEELELLYKDPSYIKSVSLKRYYMRTKIEKKYLAISLSHNQLKKLNKDYQILLENKMIYQDIKYGNFMIWNSKVYWIDFEHCKKHNFISKSFFETLNEPYIKKINKHFDIDLKKLKKVCENT